MSSLCRAVALKHMMRATTRRHLLRALSVLLLAIPSAQGGVQEILAHRAHQNLEGRAAGQGGGLGTTAVGLCFRVGLAGGGGPGEAVLGCAGLRQSLEEGGLEERATLRLRGGYTPKKSRKSQSKRKPLKLKYKIVKKVRVDRWGPLTAPAGCSTFITGFHVIRNSAHAEIGQGGWEVL